MDDIIFYAYISVESVSKRSLAFFFILYPFVSLFPILDIKDNTIISIFFNTNYDAKNPPIIQYYPNSIQKSGVYSSLSLNNNNLLTIIKNTDNCIYKKHYITNII